ncbi:hypothetical protein CI102_8775 [Trichoderma harzianum]|nr:hypothetical protein CI102_8775 [Trichoderma harzianum]
MARPPHQPNMEQDEQILYSMAHRQPPVAQQQQQRRQKLTIRRRQPERVEQSHPLYVDQDQLPDFLQESLPTNAEESQATNTEESPTTNAEQSQPANVEQSQPRNEEQSQLPIVRRSQPRNETSHRCDRCSINFPSGEKLRQHVWMSSVHFVCRPCATIGREADLQSPDLWDRHLSDAHHFCNTCRTHML